MHPQSHISGEGNGNPLHYSSWKIPGTEEPGGPQSVSSQSVSHDLVTKQQQQQPRIVTIFFVCGENT